MNAIQELFEKIKAAFEPHLEEVQRKIKETTSWDGSPSRWGDDTEGYCSACLIDMNSAAGKSEKTKDLCFLPVRGPDTPAGTMESKAVIAAAGGRGISRVKKPEGVSQEDWDKAVKSAGSKLAAAYKEMDMDPPKSVMMAKERAISMHMLDEMAYKLAYEKYPLAMVHSVFVDDNGAMFVILSQDMKLYRSELNFENGDLMLSDWQEVTQEFVPKTRTTISRQADGKVRWLSVSATAVLNRDGEIDSRELFDNMVKRAEETGKYPKRIFFHQDGQKFVIGQADNLWRVGNCYVTTGLYNDSFLAQAEIKAREAHPDAWGDSISYLAIGDPELINIRGYTVPVWKDGKNTEISTLPKNEAASLFVKTEVKRQMNERQLKALADMAFAGDIEAAKKWLEQNPEEVNRQIEQGNLITRSTEGGDTETQTIEIDDEVIGAVVERMKADEIIRSLQTALDEAKQTVSTQAQAIETLQAELNQFKATVDQRFKPLETTETERRREVVRDLPTDARIVVGYKPSQQRGTEGQQPATAQIADQTLDSIGFAN